MPQAKTKIVRDLTTGSVTWTMISFAAPLFLSSLLQTLYNVADMIIIGHTVGRDGLGAVSIGTDILHFFCFAAMGFSNAGQVIISQLIGAGLQERVRKTIGTLFSFLGLASLVISTGGLLLLDQILHWVNTPQEAYTMAKSYMGICLLGMVFLYGYNVVSAILRGMGDSRHPLLFVAVAVVLNIVLDLLFVIVFKWALFGVALATVISQTVSFIWSLIFLYRNRDQFGFGFRPKDFLIDKEALRPLLKLGIPMLIQSAAISFSMLFVNSYINAYGVVASAMTGVGNKLSSIVNIVNVALSTAGSSMIGQCIGAEKYERVPKVLRVSFTINILISFFAGAITVIHPEWVFGIFTRDKDVLKMSLTYIPVLLLLFGGGALRPPMMALINGSGNFNLNLAVALLDGVLMRICLSLLLGLTFGMGVYGFWYGHALAGFTPFVIGSFYFFTGLWRTRKYIIGKQAR
ncbi:MAG: MATE family efflux transporter [Lentisphaeria bacterium]|nr:MATE family efflux transporter [Lentisphaeria bacterium]